MAGRQSGQSVVGAQLPSHPLEYEKDCRLCGWYTGDGRMIMKNLSWVGT